MYIYKITNNSNGKIYIGLTTRTVAERWDEHVYNSSFLNYAIYRAFRKYGLDGFSCDEIDRAESLADLERKEVYWIKYYDSMNPAKGYNMIMQDDHVKILSSEVKAKIGESQKTRLINMSESYKKEIYNKASYSHQGRKKRSTKRYVGICKLKKYGSYSSEIIYNQIKYSKNFPDEIEAAEAYDKVALYLYGDDATLNFEDKREIYQNEDLELYFSFFTTPSKSGRKSKRGYVLSELPKESKENAKKNLKIFIKERINNLDMIVDFLISPVFYYNGDLYYSEDQ